MADYTPHEAPAKNIKDLPVMHPGRPVGRDEELRQIYGYLQNKQAVLIHGVSGIGKTTLAAALAAAYTQQPGGVLWLDGSDDTMASLLVRVGRAYGLDNVTTSERPTAHVGEVANTLMQNRPFIVVDNITDETTAVQFAEKCASGLPLLILSTEELPGTWANVHLKPLSEADAVTLFKQKAGISDDSHDATIANIAQLVEYLPYPLVIAARAMAATKEQPDDYLPKLRTFAETVGGNGPVAALTASYRALNNALQGLLLMLGATFTGEASAEFLSMVSGAPEASIHQATDILSRLFLVEKFERFGETYYRLHPFVYRFAQTWLKGSNRLDALQEKVRDAVLAYAKKYSATGSAGHQKLAAEINNFIATARHYSEQGERDTANQLVLALTQANGFLQERGYVYEVLQLRGSGSGFTAAFPAYGPDAAVQAILEDDEDDYEYDEDDYDDDEYGEGDYDDDESFDDEGDDVFVSAGEDAIAAQVAGVSTDEDVKATVTGGSIPQNAGIGRTGEEVLSELSTEQLRERLAQARADGETEQVTHILRAMGQSQAETGYETQAIATYNELLTAYDEGEQDREALTTLDTLSSLLVQTDNCQAAIMHVTRGLQLAEKLDDQATRQRLYITLGDARQSLGESEAAVTAFNQALELARQHNDDRAEPEILLKLGYAHLDSGETDTAIQTWNQARDLFKTQGRRSYEGRVLGGLGTAYSEMERWSEAVRFHKSSLHIAREVESSEEEAQALSHLAQAQVGAGQLPDALLSYRQALHLAYEADDDTAIVSAIVDLVGLLMRSKRHLAICDMLISDALAHDANDRDANDLKSQITQRLQTTAADGVQQVPVVGNARDYAANAYQLLDG